MLKSLPVNSGERRNSQNRYGMTYRAPVADIAFTLKHGAGLRALAKAASSAPTTSTPCWKKPAASPPT